MATSPPTYLTHADLLDLLREAKGDQQLDAFASAIGISPSLLSNVLCGYRKAHSPKLLKFLGVKRVTMYAYARDGKGK